MCDRSPWFRRPRGSRPTPPPTGESWSGPVSGEVSVALNSEFRVSSQFVNGMHEAAYAYDGDGLIVLAGALDIDRRADNGLITGTTLGNVTTTETQNAHGEPDSVAALLGGSTLWGARYTRDALGRITGITETVLGTTTLYGYAYSDTGFLKTVSVNGVVGERYGYDGNGNRVRFDAPGDSASATCDAQDRLLRYRDTRYAYSAAGDLVRKIAGTDTTHLTYDPLGNLIEVRLAGGDTIRYVIDGRNRRVGRKVNGAFTHRWLYQDQLEPVAELNGAGSVIARYVYGTRAHVPDYVVRAGGDSLYRIIADHLGSVRLVVNVVNGWVAQRIDYDGFGRVTSDTNPGFQPFGYAGGLWDGASGLVRFGARDYDAQVGRWTSRDPILFAGRQTNLFTYVDGDPINARDPSGLLLGGTINAGECLGLQASEWYAERLIGEANPLAVVAYWTGGLLASLWTPTTSDATLGVLSAGWGDGRYLGGRYAARGAPKATKGLQEQLQKHLKKLEDYKANPDRFDNKGFLKDASPELRQKIIDGRVRNLEKQVENFRRQIEQAGGGG